MEAGWWYYGGCVVVRHVFGADVAGGRTLWPTRATARRNSAGVSRRSPSPGRAPCHRVHSCRPFSLSFYTENPSLKFILGILQKIERGGDNVYGCGDNRYGGTALSRPRAVYALERRPVVVEVADAAQQRAEPRARDGAAAVAVAVDLPASHHNCHAAAPANPLYTRSPIIFIQSPFL
jgi:hypothetical protein